MGELERQRREERCGKHSGPPPGLFLSKSFPRKSRSRRERRIRQPGSVTRPADVAGDVKILRGFPRLPANTRPAGFCFSHSAQTSVEQIPPLLLPIEPHLGGVTFPFPRIAKIRVPPAASASRRTYPRSETPKFEQVAAHAWQDGRTPYGGKLYGVPARGLVTGRVLARSFARSFVRRWSAVDR